MVSPPASRPRLGQLFAEPDDLVLDLQPNRPRVVVRPPRPGLERGLSLGLEALDQGLPGTG
jgi:hypothetical protein